MQVIILPSPVRKTLTKDKKYNQTGRNNPNWRGGISKYKKISPA
jgi:hypothetical protein